LLQGIAQSPSKFGWLVAVKIKNIPSQNTHLFAEVVCSQKDPLFQTSTYPNLSKHEHVPQQKKTTGLTCIY
jgi:hypothetical protein